MKRVLQIELNELNFDFVKAYGKTGHLPNLNRLIDLHGITNTVSEQSYEQLEPWIQWVTAHTGRKLTEHRVFRLGDIVEHSALPQIWEILEGMGLTVAAISPMNAENRCKKPAFFVPDPWTSTNVSGSEQLKSLHETVAHLVNTNTTGGLNVFHAGRLLSGILKYGSPNGYSRYLRYLLRSVKGEWFKALILDLFLANIFVSEAKRLQPDYATLFLNAGAHIQHHYMFNSDQYKGAQKNPDWYVGRNQDPILDVYKLYDYLIGIISTQFPNHRILIATGLHQDPYPETLYYWRLQNHEAFLDELEISYLRVEPRMSRDFIVYCKDASEAIDAEARLSSIRDQNNIDLFEIDNRGESIFVTLSYPYEITGDTSYFVDNRCIGHLRNKTAFVALKNGEHNGVGYLIDTDQRSKFAPTSLELSELFDLIISHFGGKQLVKTAI